MTIDGIQDTTLIGILTFGKKVYESISGIFGYHACQESYYYELKLLINIK